MRKGIPTKKLTKGVKAFFWMIAENAFSTYLVLLFGGLILSSIIFYRYTPTFQRVELLPEDTQQMFQYELFERMVSEWRARTEKSQEVETTLYSNPFIPTFLLLEGISEELTEKQP
ncbi:MAG: hypothetical protein AAB567_03410 [Patescibacteria group bacterium]